MKIRTDFVTNSSSSSFTVNILIKDVDGNEYTASSDPDGYASEGSCAHDLACTAEELLNVGSVSELVNMLVESMKDSENEIGEYELKEAKELGNVLNQKVKDLSQIETITLTRTWDAWGEAASCFNWNMDSYAPDLRELAQAVLDTDGDEKESAKASLIKYLESYDGTIYGEWGGQFPAGFLGAKVKGSIEWNNLAEDIESFAQMVVDEQLPNNDYAEETTEIDMQNHTIKQEAKYILGGPGGGDEEEEW